MPLIMRGLTDLFPRGTSCAAYPVDAALPRVSRVREVPVFIGGVCDPIPARKSRYVEIVPHLIAPDDQVSLDPQGFVWRRHPEHVPGWQAHLNYFQWPFPDELPDAGLDIAPARPG
jgi:hypothetical protein